MIPKRIIQCWFGSERPERIRQFMIGVRKHHPGWEVLVFHEDNVKDLGLDVADLKHRCVNWAGVSNVVRLHAVNKYGGIWLDSDIEVLKPFTPLLSRQAFAAKQDADRICNAVFGAVENHPWLQWQIRFQNRLLTQDAAEGVFLMTEAPRDGVEIIPTPWVYPFLYDVPVEKRCAMPSSYCIHHWDGSWTKK